MTNPDHEWTHYNYLEKLFEPLNLTYDDVTELAKGVSGLEPLLRMADPGFDNFVVPLEEYTWHDVVFIVNHDI